MTYKKTNESLDLAARAIELAIKLGCDAADAVVVAGQSASVSIREGEREAIDNSESLELGLRVLTGTSQAVVSTSKVDDDELATLAERAVAMARVAPGDRFNGLAEATAIAREFPELDLADETTLDTADLLRLALEAECSGRSVKGVSASGGAGASASRRSVALAASNGFRGQYERTGYGISAAMIAGSGTKMARDYEYSSTLHFKELEQPGEIGRKAGERTARRVNPRKVKSQSAPVIFDQRVASSLLGHLANAINGSQIARGMSFLKDAMGDRIFANGVTITDNSLLRHGHGSKPFDGEGLATGKTTVVDDGVLSSWLLDLHSARQLGLQSTGNAARGTSSAPAPSSTNFNMQPGPLPPEELLAMTKNGFLVTELIGMGVNAITGDYSRGASGFWIEDGEISFPVSEITIAGNLKDMFLALTPASDLIIRGSTNAPTCRIEEMTIAGI